MNVLVDHFPQNCALASLNQIGGFAETAPSSARGTARYLVVASFGRNPKLRLQNFARTTPVALQPVWAEQVVSGVRNWKIINQSNGLISEFKLGGVNHPLRGWGRTPQGGISHSHPERASRAEPEQLNPTTATRSAKNTIAVVFHPSNPPKKETTHG
jgi:hypothetical protein